MCVYVITSSVNELQTVYLEAIIRKFISVNPHNSCVCLLSVQRLQFNNTVILVVMAR